MDNNQNKNKTIKKKLIIALVVVSALILLMLASVIALDAISNILKKDAETHDFIFYEADYTENIFDDPEYISLIENGYISYCDMDNVTLGIDENDVARYGKDVEFIVDYIKFMINGDVKGYNNCYSNLYYTKEDPKDNFTMQKIYDVVITKKSEKTLSEKGDTYNQYVFALNYKILKNNGTLRDDFLNGSRTQYIYITDREGTLKIDGITVLIPATK